MQDPELVFEKLMLKSGDVFLDLGCGAGDYSLYAAKIVGTTGRVYAIDLWEKYLDGLKKAASVQNLKNIYTNVCDIRAGLDIVNGSVDVCFISTVLHMFGLAEIGEKLFIEIRRVLKPGGCLSIIECKKEQMPFGPPLNMRISEEELEKVLGKYGFLKTDYIDLGANYMVMFATKQ